jgi:hypothetical protein
MTTGMGCSAARPSCEVFKHLFAGLVTCVDFSKQNLLCATTTRPEDGIYVVDVQNGKRVQVSYEVVGNSEVFRAT